MGFSDVFVIFINESVGESFLTFAHAFIYKYYRNIGKAHQAPSPREGWGGSSLYLGWGLHQMAYPLVPVAGQEVNHRYFNHGVAAGLLAH